MAITPGADDPAPRAEKMRHYVELYLSANHSENASVSDLLTFVTKLEEKKQSIKQEKNFLHFLFTKTHQRFLKHYTQYASFNELLDDGTYNCLTGTALYALLLDHFGFDYQILETNYHIFVVTNTEQGKILFEATDPADGFVSNAERIEKRIETYKQNTPNSSTNKTCYQHSFKLYNQVSLDQMLGLFYYNMSIVAYNDHKLVQAVNYLDLSSELYDSPRIMDFSKIVFLTIQESDLPVSEKEICLKRIQTIRSKPATTVLTVVSR